MSRIVELQASCQECYRSAGVPIQTYSGDYAEVQFRKGAKIAGPSREAALLRGLRITRNAGAGRGTWKLRWGRRGTAEAGLAELKKQARAAGADAIIDTRENRSRVHETFILHLTGTGIRYRHD